MKPTSVSDFILDLSSNGQSKHRLGFRPIVYHRVNVRYLPFVESEYFEFRFKIHRAGYVLIGWGTGKEKCRRDVPSVKGNYPDDEYPGRLDGSLGWHNCANFYRFRIIGIQNNTKQKYKQGDIAGMIVNRRKKEITLTKNGENIEIHTYTAAIPKIVQLAGCVHGEDDEVELVYFRDFDYSEEIEKDLEERKEFILNNFEVYIFNEEERKSILFDIKLQNISFENIPKGLVFV